MGILNFLFHLIEVLAAIAGTYFILRNNRVKNDLKIFVYYLWLTVFVETLGVIPRLIDSFEAFDFLQTSLLSNTIWIYNFYLIITFVVYLFLFKEAIQTIILRRIILILKYLFVAISFVYFVYYNNLFRDFSSSLFILGSIFLLIAVMVYFFEILKSDTILTFNKSIYFYIAVGALIFYLSMTPLFIFHKYYKNSVSPDFVKIYSLFRGIAIIFMYSCYTVGFILCLKKKKSYY